MCDHCSEVLLHQERKFVTVQRGQNDQNLPKKKKTLPEAQRTQGIDSLT